jgi:hypothetical protein
MTVIFYVIAGLLVAGLMVASFVRLDAARAAGVLRVAAPVTLGAFGVALPSAAC